MPLLTKTNGTIYRTTTILGRKMKRTVTYKDSFK